MTLKAFKFPIHFSNGRISKKYESALLRTYKAYFKQNNDQINAKVCNFFDYLFESFINSINISKPFDCCALCIVDDDRQKALHFMWKLTPVTMLMNICAIESVHYIIGKITKRPNE